MNYPEFREELFLELQKITPKEISIAPVQVEKLNGCIRFGISFEREDAVFAPTIYLEPFYKSFQKGRPMEALARELFDCYEEEMENTPECVDSIQSYENARDYIFCKLVHLKENQNMLADTPHITFFDFAIVAYFEVNDSRYKGSILIKDFYLDIWKISAEELLKNALEKTRAEKQVLFQPMSELLAHYISEEDGEIYDYAQSGMYVLTNTDKYLGAILVYYPEILAEIREKLKVDFYLLPSSVHEWIIMPVSEAESVAFLQQMVRDINRAEVMEEEVLSDNIYTYVATEEGPEFRCLTENVR